MAESVNPLLKIANSSVLQQFLHDCVDDLIGVKQANFNNYNSDIEWTIEDFSLAKTNIQKICRQNATEEPNSEVNIDNNLQQEIQKCLEIRREDIFQFLVKEKLVNSGHNLVENIDWRLKWVLGNSKLATINEPLVQIDLHCLKSGPNYDKLNRNTVNFEVNLETLDLLIEQLEKARKELDVNK